MKKLFLVALALVSLQAEAGWTTYGCYRHSQKKDGTTDKFFAYDEARRQVQLDKKPKTYRAKFRGDWVSIELKNIELKVNRSSHDLTLGFLEGVFKGREMKLECVLEE